MNHTLHIGLAVATLTLAACQSDVCHITVEDTTRNSPTYTTQHTPDSIRLCRLPDTDVLYFNEPGNVYIELSPQEGQSRVSGTRLNNEWQALNDTVAKYDKQLRQILGPEGDSLNPRIIHRQVSQIYETLNQRINETALRNRDNALGRYIVTHFAPRK